MTKKPTEADLFKNTDKEPAVKYEQPLSQESTPALNQAEQAEPAPEPWKTREPRVYEGPVRMAQLRESGSALTHPVAPTMHHFTGSVAAPKLYIRGRSTLDGRLATTLRIRPSLIEDLERVAVGPLYLLVDVAVQRLIAELMDMPKDAPSIAIAAESMDPGVYDRALLQEADRVPKKRAEYLHAAKARKAAEANEPASEPSDESGDGVDK